jgi:MFS family permease
MLWLCALCTLLYLDRICLSQAIKPIKTELSLSDTEISYVLMAFTLSYGLFAVPTGRLGDLIGSRKVLTWIVVGWSLFTALTGLAGGLAALVSVRLLFGAMEAGAFPNTVRVISRWFPDSERGRMQGAVLAATQLGAVVSPVMAAYLIEEAGWRWMFAVFGCLGVAWAIGFWLWFRDDPAAHPSVNAEELELIRASRPPPALDPGPVPWRAILTSRGVLCLCLIMVLGSFYTYFFYGWFPTYLSDSRHVENVSAGWLASLVLGGSAIGVLLGGWLADGIARWFSDPIPARRYLGVICYLVSASCLFAGVRCDDSLALAALWGCSFCAMHITLPNLWSIIIPQAGKHVGTLFGLINGTGVIGAIASQGFVGRFADWQLSRGLHGRAQWDPLFDVYVIVLLLAGAAWWLYRFHPLEPNIEPVEPREE